MTISIIITSLYSWCLVMSGLISCYACELWVDHLHFTLTDRDFLHNTMVSCVIGLSRVAVMYLGLFSTSAAS